MIAWRYEISRVLKNNSPALMLNGFFLFHQLIMLLEKSDPLLCGEKPWERTWGLLPLLSSFLLFFFKTTRYQRNEDLVPMHDFGHHVRMLLRAFALLFIYAGRPGEARNLCPPPLSPPPPSTGYHWSQVLSAKLVLTHDETISWFECDTKLIRRSRRKLNQYQRCRLSFGF